MTLAQLNSRIQAISTSDSPVMSPTASLGPGSSAQSEGSPMLLSPSQVRHCSSHNDW